MSGAAATTPEAGGAHSVVGMKLDVLVSEAGSTQGTAALWVASAGQTSAWQTGIFFEVDSVKDSRPAIDTSPLTSTVDAMWLADNQKLRWGGAAASTPYLSSDGTDIVSSAGLKATTGFSCNGTNPKLLMQVEGL